MILMVSRLHKESDVLKRVLPLKEQQNISPQKETAACSWFLLVNISNIAGRNTAIVEVDTSWDLAT